jgi:hypothetical protein
VIRRMRILVLFTRITQVSQVNFIMRLLFAQSQTQWRIMNHLATGGEDDGSCMFIILWETDENRGRK